MKKQAGYNISIPGNKCCRCDHIWVPRSEATVCPKCKSPYWNKPKQRKKRKRKK